VEIEYHREYQPIHSDDKPFICNLCDYSCKDKNQLKTHRLIHFDDKFFTCDQCDYGCYRRDRLKAHMLKHNKDQVNKYD
jgi:Zinc finger, C2H2 type